MEFRTEFPLPNTAIFDLNHQTAALTLGSCFAENMGNRLAGLQFPVCNNPFGIIYNPASLADCINYLVTDEGFKEEDLFFHNHLWHSWRHHSRFSKVEKNATLDNLNASLETARSFFNKTKFLFLTLGTAHVYVEKNTQRIVANCHKAPPQYFDKKRLSPSEIETFLTPVLEKILVQNNDLQVIISVSPIRHLRDGLVENNRSKAALLLAADALSERFERAHYFPAYELVMDDLRDYRFFEPDMMHPTPQAIDYVWQHFSHTFFSKNTHNLVAQVEKINAMRQHRPLHVDTPQYQQFVNTLRARENDLVKRFPFLKFDENNNAVEPIL